MKIFEDLKFYRPKKLYCRKGLSDFVRKKTYKLKCSDILQKDHLSFGKWVQSKKNIFDKVTFAIIIKTKGVLQEEASNNFLASAKQYRWSKCNFFCLSSKNFSFRPPYLPITFFVDSSIVCTVSSTFDRGSSFNFSQINNNIDQGYSLKVPPSDPAQSARKFFY